MGGDEMNKHNKNYYTFVAVALFFLLVVGGVYAYFSAQAISDSNKFKTGSMSLVLSDDNQLLSTSIDQSWGGSQLVPGMVLPEKKIEIFNNGTIHADHVDIQFSYTGDENIAKNMLFGYANHAFRYGGSGDATSVNLLTALKGVTDPDYIVTQGDNGQPFTASTVDGIDGSVKDGRFSLHELSLFGKIRIQKGEERGGIDAGTAADLWLNADIAEGLTVQNGELNMKITVSIDQHASQF